MHSWNCLCGCLGDFLQKSIRNCEDGSWIDLKKLIVTTLAVLLTLSGSLSAQAHQPVQLLATDTTAAKGSLLVDGTVSYAVRAEFTKAAQTRGFRVGFKAGDQLSLQYLIIDKNPENALAINQLPLLTLTYPSGKKLRLKLNERTTFFEPFSQTNFLYLGRYSGLAEEGIHTVEVKSVRKARITIAVGDREVRGEVIRG